MQPVRCECHWRVNDNVCSKFNPVNLAKMVAEVEQRCHCEPMNQQAMHVALQASHSLIHGIIAASESVRSSLTLGEVYLIPEVLTCRFKPPARVYRAPITISKPPPHRIDANISSSPFLCGWYPSTMCGNEEQNPPARPPSGDQSRNSWYNSLCRARIC